MKFHWWLFYAVFLFIQNYSFTFVSRARNSGSLIRHLKAAIFSNGVYMATFIFSFKIVDYVVGKYGFDMTLFTIAYYTLFTVAGSLFAHWQAMRTEKGKDAVGHNKRYAQIPVEEWEKVKALIDSVPTRKEVLA